MDTYFKSVPDLTDMSEAEILSTKLETLDKYGKHNITVNEIFDGKLSQSNQTKTATADEINAKIGKEVNYSGYTANYSGGWRIFYATDEETFLITTDTIPLESDIPTVSKTGKEYTGSFDVAKSIYGRMWNKEWVIDKLNQSIDEGASSVQSQGRHKCAAYLCDTENWTEYLTGSANYAVGGPTLELFVKAWEKRPGGSEGTTTYSVNESGYSQIRNMEVTTDILALQGTTKGLYNNGDDYFLASSDSDNSNPVSQWSVLIFTSQNGEINGTMPADRGVRPIVSIPTSKISISGDTVTILP